MLSNTLKKYIGYRFSTGTTPGKDYISFQTKMRNDLKKQAEENGMELHTFNKNHYEFSAVLKDKINSQFVYLSIPDVRYNQDGWSNHTLFRTMKNDRDRTGGQNMYTTWDNIGSNARILADRSCNSIENEKRNGITDTKNIKEMFDAFDDNGKYAESIISIGKLEIAKGGYDLLWDISLNAEPIIECIGRGYDNPEITIVSRANKGLVDELIPMIYEWDKDFVLPKEYGYLVIDDKAIKEEKSTLKVGDIIEVDGKQWKVRSGDGDFSITADNLDSKDSNSVFSWFGNVKSKDYKLLSRKETVIKPKEYIDKGGKTTSKPEDLIKADKGQEKE